MVTPAALALTAILAPVIGGIVQQTIASAGSRGSSTRTVRSPRRTKYKKYTKRSYKPRVNYATAKYDIGITRVPNPTGTKFTQLL